MVLGKFTYKGLTLVEDDGTPGVPVINAAEDGGDVILQSLTELADRTYNTMVDLGDTGAAPIATDLDDGNAFKCTATGNFTLSNPTKTVAPYDGQRVTWRITQGAGFPNTIALGG